MHWYNYPYSIVDEGFNDRVAHLASNGSRDNLWSPAGLGQCPGVGNWFFGGGGFGGGASESTPAT